MAASKSTQKATNVDATEVEATYNLACRHFVEAQSAHRAAKSAVKEARKTYATSNNPENAVAVLHSQDAAKNSRVELNDAKKAMLDARERFESVTS